MYQGELSVPRLYCYWCLKVLIALPWHDLFWLFQAVSQHITETQKRYVNLDNKEKKKVQIHCVEFLWQKKYKSARPTKKETEIRYSGGTVASAYTHPLSPGSLSLASCPHPLLLNQVIYPNTEKRVETTSRSRVLWTNVEVFGNLVKHCRGVWYIFSIETKPKEKTEKCGWKKLIYWVERQTNRILNLKYYRKIFLLIKIIFFV